ncbi:MAG: hypothetical protein WCI61_02975 [Chloroflexota bacterium]
MLHFLALWLLVRIGGVIPLAVLDRIAGAAGSGAWWASRRIREVTRDHMRHVLGPDDTAHNIDRAARECVRTAAHGYAEFAHLHRLSPTVVRSRITSTDGIEALAAAHAEGRGVIIVSAHLGAPEVISHAAPTFDVDMAGVAEPLRPQRVHDFVQAMREVTGVQYFSATLAGLREARAHLGRGGALGILVDRDVLHTGRPYAFFGERALMPTGAVELARRTGAPIVAVWCYRAADAGRYRLVARPVPLPEATGVRATDVDSGMRAVLAALEAAIREEPGQWFPLVPVWSGLGTARADCNTA